MFASSSRGVDRREFVVGAAALALGVRGGAAQAGQRPVIGLVTADLESRLVAIDIERGRILRYVETLSYPRSIETVGAVAVVAHSDLGVVSIVDGRSLSITHVLRGFGEPRYTAAHPGGRYAFITDAERGEVVALDVVQGRVLGRTEVGPFARHVTIDRGGRTLAVALGSKAEEVAIVDVSKVGHPRLVRRFRPPFLAHDVGFAPDERHLWVSSGNRFELAVYDVQSGRLLARPSGDWPPQHVTFSDESVYVTSGWSGTLRIHRFDGSPGVSTPVPVGSYNVQQASGWVLTPSLGHGDLCILDLAGRLLRQVKVARSSHDACLVRGG
jgi:DNA-binding beta-propeller fold protein YncE